MPVPPSEIPDFDPAENGSSKYLLGTYHDLFDKKVITVIAPVTQGFTTKGYLLLHKPYEDSRTADFFFIAKCLYYHCCHLHFIFLHTAGIPLFHLPAAAEDHRGCHPVCLRQSDL